MDRLNLQYRTSAFDVSEKNPFGAKCIFCKSPMITLDHLAAAHSAQSHVTEYRK
ncbi:cold shock small protein YmcF [Enterobacter roggenkampii]|uniref:cold shock small protein YmcF n=1 Tax=Enterobacter roggenkampii TaxID=1812935 RepID=UPI003F75BA31